MTIPTVSELRADPRRVDTLVAEKVMGWTQPDGGPNVQLWYNPQDQRRWKEPPRYCEDWQAAGEVVEKIRGVDVSENSVEEWVARTIDKRDNPHIVIANGKYPLTGEVGRGEPCLGV